MTSYENELADRYQKRLYRSREYYSVNRERLLAQKRDYHRRCKEAFLARGGKLIETTYIRSE